MRSHQLAPSAICSRSSTSSQKTSNNSFTIHPCGLHRGSGICLLPNRPLTPEFLAGTANGIAGSSLGQGEYKPKLELGEPPTHQPWDPSATPASSLALSSVSPASATPSQHHWVSSATSTNDSFKIWPASKPDMNTIPGGDLQARALPSLRVNSHNSFVFIPKGKATGAPPPQGRQPCYEFLKLTSEEASIEFQSSELNSLFDISLLV
ncbi:taperin-like [Myotis myotis]|uniref:taperin-like n=1 Tax=Myotis myotis TaxID=51298 RepID=UPI0017490AC3|nr:taperin-like [Myotis myotis]